MQVVLGRQREVIVPGVLCVDRGNWEQERDIFLYRVLAFESWTTHFTECTVLWKGFWQESRLIPSRHIQRCWSFSEKVRPRVGHFRIFFKPLPQNESWCSYEISFTCKLNSVVQQTSLWWRGLGELGNGLLLERLSMTFTANGKNETSAVCL